MKLDGKLPEIISFIYEGMSHMKMAETLGVSTRTLYLFLCEPENEAEYKAALRSSALTYAEKAEDVLLRAPRDRNEMTRARELAQHYRWMASKRNPSGYGDKVEVEAGPKLVQTIINLGTGIKPPEED